MNILSFLLVAVVLKSAIADHRNRNDRNLIRGWNSMRKADASDESLESSINGRFSKQKWTKSVTMEEFEANPEAFADDLDNDGVWIKWNVSNSMIPENAVYGGSDEDGNYFVMRADVNFYNMDVGLIIGKFNPSRKTALLIFLDTVIKETSIEILLHNKYAWADRHDKRSMIPGASGDHICRVKFDERQLWMPGRLDMDGVLCRVAMPTKEVTSKHYQVLVKACGQSSHDQDPLNMDGLWIKWNSSMTFMPGNAVVGGYGDRGPIYVMMAEHETDEGLPLGKLPGIYFPMEGTAHVEYDGRMYNKTEFELLTHNSYTWKKSPDTGVAIPAGDSYGFCRFPADRGAFWWPGRWDRYSGTCTVTYYGTILEVENNFYKLNRACNDLI